MMSRTSLMAALALASSLALGGADRIEAQQTAPAAPREEPLPPPIAYRQSIMMGLQSHSAAIRAIVDGGAGDPTHILDHATALVQLSLMSSHIFPAGSGGERSRARDEIWQNAAGFETRLQALQSASSTLLQAAYSGDKERIANEARALQMTCAGCHREFRKPASN